MCYLNFIQKVVLRKMENEQLDLKKEFFDMLLISSMLDRDVNEILWEINTYYPVKIQMDLEYVYQYIIRENRYVTIP